MNVSYTEPLARAWARMKQMLFRPFVFQEWLTYGLASFLAYLGSGGSGGSLGNWTGSHKGKGSIGASGPFEPDAVRGAAEKYLHDPFWLMIIAVALIAFAVLFVVVLWVSSRARLVFAHNVATGRAAFREPWSRYARQGQSLFLWYAAFSFTMLVPIAALVLAFLTPLRDVLHGETPSWPALSLLIGAGGFAFVCMLVIAFVGLLVNEFVVPLMMHHDEMALAAWARFMPLLRAHFGEFVAYAVFLAVLWIGVSIALVLVGLVTCCIGLLLMVIPYVGSVLLLPVSVTARAYGLEFLAQFGPEWNVLRPLESASSAAPPAPPTTA